MKKFVIWPCVVLLLLCAGGCSGGSRALAIGSAAPDFSLPGVDGKTHSLAEYASSRVLAVVFTCNHCPTAQLYEERLRKLDEDYRSQGVRLVAINSERADAVLLSELAYSDVGDSLAESGGDAAFRRGRVRLGQNRLGHELSFTGRGANINGCIAERSWPLSRLREREPTRRRFRDVSLRVLTDADPDPPVPCAWAPGRGRLWRGGLPGDAREADGAGDDGDDSARTA